MTGKLKRFFEHASLTELPLQEALSLAEKFDLSLADVERTALQSHILPTRYLRNGLRCEEQLKLSDSQVSIIGCGGLGGATAMLLARTGIGKLHLVDPDSFEEHNINRQQFCTLNTIGLPKTEAAAMAISQINPALTCTVNTAYFGREDLRGNIVVDCLDASKPRLKLAALCAETDLPLIHGSVKEWYGRVGTSTRQNKLIETLYSKPTSSQSLTPQVIAPTVYQIASLQAAEVIKELLGFRSVLKLSWLDCDLKSSDFEKIDYCDC